MTIYFDMDGTLVDFYGVEGWLENLIKCNPRPYAIAKPRMRFCDLAKEIHKVQANGIKVGIVSWLAKNSTAEFDEIVTETKKEYLAKHLPSVKFDEIKIVPYGTPKSKVVDDCGYLFDDELNNRIEWGFEISFGVENILKTLKVFS